MTPIDDVRACLEQALTDPARSLVRLWILLHDQGALEPGLDRDTLAFQVRVIRRALQNENPVPETHALAALQAVDEHLREAVDLGNAPQVRRVELSQGEGTGAFLVVPRPAGWISRLAATQPGHLEYWMRHHHVIPALHRGIGIRVCQAPRLLAELLASSGIPFAAGGFLDEVLPDWNDRSPFRCSCLLDPAVRWKSVESILTEAKSLGSRLVVFPELTLDGAVRHQLRNWLREESDHPFVLVVAGSFHETGGADAAGPRHGVSRALDRWGEELLVHRKLRPMRAMPQGETADEDLTGHNQVELLLAPFGLTGVAICLDFCEIGNTPVTDLWRAIGPALMLVPSMGGETTNHAHRDRAHQLALQHGTATVVASQHPQESEAVGFCWTLIADENGATVIHAGEDSPMLHGNLGWTRTE